MKKILLAIGTLLIVSTIWFITHSFAAGSQALWIVTDKDNQEWCAFPYQTIWQEDMLDEHKQIANENRGKWALCSDYNIDKTDAQILEQYRVGSPTNDSTDSVNLKWRKICLKDGQEIPCSESAFFNSLSDYGKEQFLSWDNHINSWSSNKLRSANTWTTISNGCKIDGIPVNCKTWKPINSVTNSWSSLWDCKVNGKSVDCDQAMKEVGWFLKMGLWIMLGFGALSLVGFVFWLVMLIHACSNDIPNKVLWIVLLFLFGIIAAIVYYFAVKRHCVTNYIPPANTQPYQASVTVGYQEGPVATTPVVVVAPVPPAPPTTPPVNPITPIITTPVSTMPPTTPPSPTIPTAAATTQTVESMIATSGAETMSQAPLGSSSSVTPTVPPFDQNNTPLQNPPSTNI